MGQRALSAPTWLHHSFGGGDSLPRGVFRSHHGVRSHRAHPRLANLLAEVRRLLSPAGIAIISTPNKAYYTESRGADGEKTRSTCTNSRPGIPLGTTLPCLNTSTSAAEPLRGIRVLSGATFLPVEARFDSSGGEETAVTSLSLSVLTGRVPDARSFVYVPRAANVLRERERHIVLLVATRRGPW
jgi:hypothetical protein